MTTPGLNHFRFSIADYIGSSNNVKYVNTRNTLIYTLATIIQTKLIFEVPRPFKIYCNDFIPPLPSISSEIIIGTRNKI